MGSPEQKRCVHCRIVYSWWLGSTPYTNDQDNSSDYCPECHKAIRLALEAIPKKRGVKYVETNKFTCMDLDPHTPEPTDLPPKVDREFVLKPMEMPRRTPRIFEIGGMSSYREGELIKADPESASLREIADEAFLVSVNENYEKVKPVAVTTRKPDPNGPADRLMSGKSAGTHEPYKPLHLRSEYSAVSMGAFSKEPIPEGFLPMYDKDPDIAPLFPEAIPYSVQRDEGGLIDMLDPHNHHKARHVVRDGVTYYYEWWTRTGKAAGKVSVKMEVDAVTGEVIGPWKDYR